LQAALGGETATFDQVFDLATLDQEGATRAIASQVVLSTIERDRRLRRMILSAVRRMNDTTLADFTGTTEGRRVQDLLEYLNAHSREPSLQRKAGLALDRFRAATG
jgi:hypothetical protein